MVTPNLLQEGLGFYRAGNLDRASEILARFVRTNPGSAEGWYWLGICRTDPSQKIFCFRKTLSLYPDYTEAQRELEKLENKPKTGSTGELDALRASLSNGDEKKFERPEDSKPLDYEPVVFSDRQQGGGLEDLRASLLNVVEPSTRKEPPKLEPPPTTEEKAAKTGQVEAEVDELRRSLVGSAYQEFDEAVQGGSGLGQSAFSDEQLGASDRLSSLDQADSTLPDLREGLLTSKPFASKPKTGNGPPKFGRVWWLPWVLLLLVVLVIGILVINKALNSYGASIRTPVSQSIALATPTKAPSRTPAAFTRTPAPTPGFTLTFTPAPPDAPSFQNISCGFTLPIGPVVECGFVSVPESRAGELQNKIELYVAVFHNLSGNPSDDPVIFIPGGPGSAAVNTLAHNYKNFIEPIIKEKDFIVFDPRGTGGSQPILDCPELKAVYIKNFIQPLSDEPAFTTALQACLNDVKNKGIDPASYSTSETAADVKDILHSLGYKQASLLGASYGSRIAQEIIRTYPEIVYSAILDSAIPLEVKLFNQYSATTGEALQALFEGCASDTPCSESYPNLESHFTSLVAELDTQPITLTLSLSSTGLSTIYRLDGSVVTSAIVWALQKPDLLPVIPQIIEHAWSGDYSSFGNLLTLPGQSFNGLSLGVYLSMMCHDQAYATSSQQLSADIQSHPDTAKLAQSYAFGGPDSLYQICSLWGASQPDPSQGQPLASNVPMLILAGKYDPIAPPSFARSLAAHLTNSTLVEFHDETITPGLNGSSNDCPMSIIVNFIRDPNAALPTSCVDAEVSPNFIVPYTGVPPLKLENSKSLATGISGDYPVDWTSTGHGAYFRMSSELDKTQLIVQFSQLSASDWIDSLMKEFNSKEGFDELPYRATSRAVNGLNWALYRTTSLGLPVDLAFAEFGQQTWMVLMLSNSDERSALYKTLYIPVIDSIMASSTK